MNKETFNKMMGYPMETIEQLAKQAKQINRIIELNQRDLQQNGIEND
jgi:predicted ATP-grasp superfamily ATP-dependent carboligase